jgi:hypothetical protein
MIRKHNFWSKTRGLPMGLRYCFLEVLFRVNWDMPHNYVKQSALRR